jgi:hypothetical protein
MFEVLRESVIMNLISLDSSRSELVKGDNGFEIRIQCNFEENCWDSVKPILHKHDLSIRVADGYVTIYSKANPDSGWLSV